MDSWHCCRIYERTNPSKIKDPLLTRRAQRSTPLSVSSTAKLVRVVQFKNWYFFKIIWAHRSIFRFYLHKHAVGELFCGSQLTATTCLRWSWCKAVLLCTGFGNRGSLLHGFACPYIDTRDNCPLLPLLG